MTTDLIKATGDQELTSSFSFWTPLEKAGDENGLHIVQGLTSSASLDQQRERVLQEGLDFQPLVKSGFINWNHQPGPENVIGQPLEAEFRETRHGFGLWLRGLLYKGHARAEEAWSLLKALEDTARAGVRGRQMGWSVEGGILARHGNTIRKSVVRHMALTHEPVNGDTYAEIAKSLGADGRRFGAVWTENQQFSPDTNTHYAFDSFEAFAKAVASGPGVGGPGAMGDASPLQSGRADISTLLGHTCGGTCRRYGKGRKKSLAHLIDCLGHDEDDAVGLMKSLIDLTA